MLPIPDILTIQSNNTNRHNSALVILILLTTVLVSGFTTNIVFADSKLLKLDTKQNATCDTVGAHSPISSSCDQRAANNVNNGVPRTGGAAAPTTGTLIVNKVCVTSTGGGPCPGNPSFGVQVTGTNSPASSFSLTDGGSQAVTLAAGSFTVREAIASGFTPSFSGNCMQTVAGSGEATGTIAAGEQQTCTITNTEVPGTGTLTVNKVCVSIINPDLCQGDRGHFNLVITGNNPNPPGFELGGGGSQDITLGSGPFTLTETSDIIFTGSVSGDCALVSSQAGKLVVTGTISEGQRLICTITNSES